GLWEGGVAVEEGFYGTALGSVGSGGFPRRARRGLTSRCSRPGPHHGFSRHHAQRRPRLLSLSFRPPPQASCLRQVVEGPLPPPSWGAARGGPAPSPAGPSAPAGPPAPARACPGRGRGRRRAGRPGALAPGVVPRG